MKAETETDLKTGLDITTTNMIIPLYQTFCLLHSESKDAWIILPKEDQSPKRILRAYTAKRINLDESIEGQVKKTVAQVRV